MTGHALRKIRRSLGLTLEEFAKRLGYHWVHVQRMETGRAPVSRRCILEIEKIQRKETEEKHA